MKRKILIGLAIAFVLFVCWSLYGLFIAPPVSPYATATYDENELAIAITYSQPSKKGRVIFGTEAEGALQPYGQYWRLGANAATEITLSKDVTLAGDPIKAGTYRMYAVPGPKVFQITLNSEVGVFFGAGEPDHDLDLLTIYAPVTKPESTVETFTIEMQSTEGGADILFSWDQSQFTLPVSAQ